MIEATDSLLAFLYPMLIATALATARAIGMVMITPAFTRTGVTGLLRSCIAVAIAAPMVPPTFDQISLLQGLSTLTVVGLMVKEVVIGALIGFVFGIPFWAAETAGDIVDLQRGTTAAQLVDPNAMSESSITGTLFSIVAVAIFFTSGGLGILADAVYRSYELWPASSFRPVVSQASGLALLKTLDGLMRIAVLLVAPIMVALLIADVMLGYLSRLAPQIHVFDLSLAVKNLLFAFLIVVYAMFLAPSLMREIGGLAGGFDLLRSLAEGR
ncbi:type III secretion system export apparatus subunit SctT [Chenggangzhangella methanolivorans]|uniref:Type III secretion system export apparatus subunit SctT n=1 Tax=Chenggangzhangella methanolivorans TaxID=1437009 RepID=A0A9E6ULR5_9HYPH|nr:type III secretion system export apparatus subunit SctT [Chenggangzhangella methanolivorans]QZN98458.1 type III secretion system export apparatus subunit SctT [Chenggangzhangella methanolivorans]